MYYHGTRQTFPNHEFYRLVLKVLFSHQWVEMFCNLIRRDDLRLGTVVFESDAGLGELDLLEAVGHQDRHAPSDELSHELFLQVLRRPLHRACPGESARLLRTSAAFRAPARARRCARWRQKAT